MPRVGPPTGILLQDTGGVRKIGMAPLPYEASHCWGFYRRVKELASLPQQDLVRAFYFIYIVCFFCIKIQHFEGLLCASLVLPSFLNTVAAEG